VPARFEAWYGKMPPFAEREADLELRSLLRAWQLILVVCLGLSCNGCLWGRIVYYNTPHLDAPGYFAKRVVEASPSPRPLQPSPHEARPRLTSWERSRYHTFDAFLEGEGTRAFIAIRDGKVLYERYFGGMTAETELPCFSMSKTFAATLVGRAVKDGLLPSLAPSVVEYIPELAGRPGYRDVTLEHLLRMTSGIDFVEESIAGAQLYYTTNLRDFMYAYDVTHRPGERYVYGSVNTQLLWDVLQRRLGSETISHYFERTIWAPLGAEYPASWSLDSSESGIEKFFGGFNARARDFAKLGLLFLDGGTVAGNEVLPRRWVEESIQPDAVAGWVRTTDGRVHRGKYQWFLTAGGQYFAKGYNGQYVFVAPAERMVFVRFGKGYGNVQYWPTLFARLAREL
jgi:CubicO group peptidase (beta-lactamase class C family)